ncbi:phospholipase D family protein [Desulfobacterales bacterium HSG2]|nr:phospholipase D family protein [Desulfobacterales bacterium HSG2]
MMEIQILSNFDSPIGEIINQELCNANSVRIAVAFLKFSGLEVIQQPLFNCLSNNGKVEIIAGLDFKTTDSDSMCYLVDLQKQTPNLKFYCYNSKTNIAFHPKIYLFETGQESTGIVGSSNLTKGGLLTNFETNIVIREAKPACYFSQLEAIYNSVRFSEFIFSPDKEFLDRYSFIYKAFLENEDKAKNESNVQEAISQIQRHEEFLRPSLRSLIIDVIKEEKAKGKECAKLETIYKEVRKLIKEKELSFKMDTFENSIRGELNRHKIDSNSPNSMRLFIRISRGCYSLNL